MKLQKEKKGVKSIVDFFFEIGILAKTPRSGFHFLGTGSQSVAEHLNRVVYIGYSLAMFEKNVDALKIMKMCMLHDLTEGRISDLNYVHQKYVEKKEKEAIKDLTETLPFGQDIEEILKEYEERKTKEAIIAKDADNLEWLLSLKEQYDAGNSRAKKWFLNVMKRLKTETAKRIANEILYTDSNEWWDKRGGPAVLVNQLKIRRLNQKT